MCLQLGRSASRRQSLERLQKPGRSSAGVILAAFLAIVFQTAPASADSVGLTLGTASVQFPNANPGTTPLIPASENPIAISVNYTGTGNWVLTVVANGDLLSAESSIPISKIRWDATGTAFNSGTLSRTAAQTVGSGTASASGTLRLFLANSWNYAAGNYGQSLIFTVTSF